MFPLASDVVMHGTANENVLKDRMEPHNSIDFDHFDSSSKHFLSRKCTNFPGITKILVSTCFCIQCCRIEEIFHDYYMNNNRSKETIK